MRSFLQQRRFLVLSLLFLCLLASAFFGTTRFAARANGAILSLSASSGSPTSIVQVGGFGFGISESVMLSFDANAVGVATTDSNGTFSTSITVPGDALPGNHSIGAVGQTSAITAQGSFLVQTNWQQFGFDSGHTGFNPYENVLSTSSVQGLTLAWSHKAVNVHYAAPPAVADGLVFAATSNDQLLALNATSGSVVWIVSNPGYLYTAPEVVNGIVYAASYDGTLSAFAEQTGNILWKISNPQNSLFSQPAVAGGTLYVGSDKLYAFNAASGVLLWSYAPAALFFGRTAVANNIVYTGASDGRIYALDATSGKLLWSSKGNGPLAASGGVVYVDRSGVLYPLNAENGKLLGWHYTTGEGVNNLVVAGGTVYVNTNHQLIALDTQGKVLWIFYKGQYNDRFTSPSQAAPVLANGVIYVDFEHAAQDILYAVNATSGSMLWRFPSKHDYYESYPVLANGWLYAGTNSLEAFHLQSAASRSK